MALPTGNNTFCGPWAVAAITGVSTDAVADLVRQRRAERSISRRLTKRRTHITGTSAAELQYALRRLKWRTFQETFFLRLKRPTLRQWAEHYAPVGEIALVLAGTHWVVVTGSVVGCSVTRDFLPIGEHPYRRKRVRYTVFASRVNRV